MGVVLCVISLKGGVGKTLTAVNLSAALAVAGKRTLLVDCDPQGSATVLSGTYKKRFALNLEDGMLGKAPLDKIKVQSCAYHLHVIPAPFGRMQQAYSVNFAPGSERVLEGLLKEAAGGYDYIVIDTPAAFGFLTLNAIVASNAVMVPTQCEYLAYRSLKQTMQALTSIKRAHRLSIKLAGILLTMYDAGEKVSELIMQSARRRLGSRVFRVLIPRDAGLRESTALERPLVVQDVFSIGARSYKALAEEIMAQKVLGRETIHVPTPPHYSQSTINGRRVSA